MKDFDGILQMADMLRKEMNKVVRTNEGKVFGNKDWFMFWCPHCKRTIQRRSSSSACEHCKKEITWD